MGKSIRTFFSRHPHIQPACTEQCQSSLPASYLHHEKEKRRKYEQRILHVEHGSFVPVVLVASGHGKAAQNLFSQIACLRSEKTGEDFGTTLAVIRCRLSFALVRASVMALRGYRGRRYVDTADTGVPAVLAAAELGCPLK
eukprot:scpid87081/ scgid2762/ 